MNPRSWLFSPGDSEIKLSKAVESGADAVILDLEDAVSPENKDTARRIIAEFLFAHPKRERKYQLWVRINPLSANLALHDLVAVVAAAPDGIVLPKANGPSDVEKLSHYLDVLEISTGFSPGTIKILPVATETAHAPFYLGAYATAGLDRLSGLTWGAEDLAAAVGASTNLDASGGWAMTYRLVRSLTLLAAHAANVQAIETLYVDFKDESGLYASSRSARAEGFGGRIAIHPAQVSVINDAFTPSSEEIAFAERVIAAFAAAPGMRTVGLDGKMLDTPHLKQAQNILTQMSAV